MMACCGNNTVYTSPFNFTGISRISGNFIPSQLTGEICCNAQTMATVGMPPHRFQYVRSCCEVGVNNIRLERDLIARRRADVGRLYR